VVAACADRPETWINADIHNTYMALHAMGQAHSVEVWMDGALAGGVFGVTLGAAFFGESMFSRRTDGSKLALVHLIERLRGGGFQLFDTQFTTSASGKPWRGGAAARGLPAAVAAGAGERGGFLCGGPGALNRRKGS
jgi:hypothetical protein